MTRLACCRVKVHSGLKESVVGKVTCEPKGVREEKIKVNQIASHPRASQSCEKNKCPAAQQDMVFDVNRLSSAYSSEGRCLQVYQFLQT